MKRKNKCRVRFVLILTTVLVIQSLWIGHVIGLPVSLSVATGPSMYPTLRPGDAVVAVKADDIRPGDIAIYRGGSGFVVHRIISINGSDIIFKGDNNPVPDPPIERGRVQYKVVTVIPAEAWVPTLAMIHLVIMSVTASLAHADRRYFPLLFIVVLSVALSVITMFTTAVTIDRGPQVWPSGLEYTVMNRGNVTVLYLNKEIANVESWCKTETYMNTVIIRGICPDVKIYLKNGFVIDFNLGSYFDSEP